MSTGKRKVYALTESRWEGDDIHAVFESGKDARTVLGAIKKEAMRKHVWPGTAQNLYIQEFDLRPAGDTALTLEDVKDCAR